MWQQKLVQQVINITQRGTCVFALVGVGDTQVRSMLLTRYACFAILLVVSVFSQANADNAKKKSEIARVEQQLSEINKALNELEREEILLLKKYEKSQKQYAVSVTRENDELSKRKRSLAKLKLKRDRSKYERLVNDILDLDKQRRLAEEKINTIKSKKAAQVVAKPKSVKPGQTKPAKNNFEKVSAETTNPKNVSFAKIKPKQAVPKKAVLPIAVVSKTKSTKEKTENISKGITENTLVIASATQAKRALVNNTESNGSQDKYPLDKAVGTSNPNASENTNLLMEVDAKTTPKVSWPSLAEKTEASVAFAKQEFLRLNSEKDGKGVLGDIKIRSRLSGTQKMNYLSSGVYSTRIQLEQGVNELRILKERYLVTLKTDGIKRNVKDSFYRVIFDVSSLSNPQLFLFDDELLN